MHELSLSINTVDTVVEQAKKQGFKRVTSVTLAIGTLSCIEPQALATGFEFASRGTIAADAQLKIESVAARVWCLDCQQHVAIPERGVSCPRCQGYQLKVEAGDELMIKHIEVE
ncbi:hydrogenase nickel insertion protein HypA [Photobacterium aquimaris]|uniref:Hydrogenase maturation factor HypA n=2 Tax=Photobacterium TaxID=657 RepID=A0A2T3IKD9_9GAMM|nr:MULTISPECIES: hydrogenase maturation nickel metallochaperone HypA [Photobacterium]OBU15648.1 hydrogenase nickel insertion protein HypA [Photobacterium aquimaris]OBU17327.1 hydrogenase nickel insertion protein HypA [Photobacterium aquimaris]PSU28797.1 hydrogenase maturation nickel metallochaperone HypA [Photobacterium aquimaris]PSW01607.1 hydrogenase maturation nickel metallochaperone HypA [Photobacterium aquimaris]SMY38269.1 Hydrogenase/urease nickel incorporation protein HypA [Photobacteri